MSEQISMKNLIFSMKSFFHKTLILSAVVMVTACQSQPKTVQKTTLQPKRVVQPPAMQVRKSSDGVQDIEWQIMTVQNRRALFF